MCVVVVLVVSSGSGLVIILRGLPLVIFSSLLFFRNVFAWSSALIVYELDALCFFYQYCRLPSWKSLKCEFHPTVLLLIFLLFLCCSNSSASLCMLAIGVTLRCMFSTRLA